MQGVVGIVGGDQSGLFGGRNLGGLSGRRGLAGEEALVGALAQLPEHDAHGEGGDEAAGQRESSGSEGSRLAGLRAPLDNRRRAERPERRPASGSRHCRAPRVIVLSAPRSGRDFDREGRAGHAVDAGQRVRPRVTLNPAWSSAELRTAGEGEAAGDPWRLGGLPRRETGGLRGRQGRSEEMNAGAAFTGMQAEADTGFGVVGEFCAPVEVDGGSRIRAW